MAEQLIRIEINGLLDELTRERLEDWMRRNARDAMARTMERFFGVPPVLLPQAQRYECATTADMPGIWDAPLVLPAAPEPVVSKVKPAMSGLGVVASDDHRLGRF